jgi:nucleoside-diphosphate-sugar epimerase
MNTVLITGAAGFIGSHLVDAYLAQGWRVVGIDNLITGNRANLGQALRSPHFELLERDITERDRELIEDLRAKYGHVDLILHFASPASPIDYAQLPLQTLAVNSKGTEFCAQAALEWKTRMLYASTSEAYGDPLQHPQRETYWGNVNPVGPRSCYDESKRFGEALVMAYVRAHDIDARIIRIFNTYGPRMRSDDGRVVPNFILQALRGEPLTIYGDGSQTRSFCYVDDLVAGIMSCAGSEATRGRVVNLGNPEEYPIAEFARIVSEIAGTPLRTLARPMPPDDPTRRCPDITVARELLGWEPKVPVREGLRRTIEQMRGTLAQAGASLS